MNTMPEVEATIPETIITPEKESPKSRKTRTVDYTRTDKKPHSFRYKRGSTFVPRGGEIVMSKEADGALVIGPLPQGVEATPEAAKYITGQIKLISVKKRSTSGKTAIVFESEEHGQIVAYDARAARAALRSA